jgi:hypothetical protein
MTILYLGVAHTPICGTPAQIEEFADWPDLDPNGIYWEQGDAAMGPFIEGEGRKWKKVSSYRGFILWQKN